MNEMRNEPLYSKSIRIKKTGKDYSAYENMYGTENGKTLTKRYAWIHVLRLYSVLIQNSKQ